MNARRIALLAGTAVTASALAIAPAATAAPKEKPVKPNFAVSKLSIVNYKKTVDVAKKDATVKFKVQVKDKSKKFNPTSVRLTVTEKVSGAEATTVVVKTKRTGKSKVVTSWSGKLTVAKGSVEPGATAVYCVSLVKVNDSDPDTLPVVKTAKGLSGRDCFTVVNSTPVPVV